MQYLFFTFAMMMILSAPSAQAQHNISGYPVYCSDFRGIPVALIMNPGLDNVGRATVNPQGAPVMLLNPSILSQLPAPLQLFWYGHECAHHFLGHLAQPSQSNESAADCFAIKTGRQQGWFPPEAFQSLIATMGNLPGSPWGHLPGPARVRNIIQCYNTP